MRGAISESGSNDSLAAARDWHCGGQGVHREVESEGHEEKYRAVIDGGCPADEPVGQRWGKVEPALWRRRRSHSPAAPRCLRTARYGRTVRDLRRTGRVSGWHRSKRTYKRERNGERCTVSSRTAEKYQKHGESHVTGYPIGRKLLHHDVEEGHDRGPGGTSGVPGDFCTSVNETNWYERSLEWHEERSTHRSRS